MERPTGVTILAVLAFIFAGLAVLGALAFFVGGSLLSSMTGSSGGMGGLLAGLGAIAGVIILIIAALYAVVGFGLWKLQNWGRILCLILVALGLLSSVLGLVKSLTPLHFGLLIWQLVWVAVDVWIITYLLRPHVKQAFGAS